MIKKRFYIDNDDSLLLPVFNELKKHGKTHIEYDDHTRWENISKNIGIINKKLGDNIIYTGTNSYQKRGLVQLNPLYDIDIRPLQDKKEIKIFPSKIKIL